MEYNSKCTFISNVSVISSLPYEKYILSEKISHYIWRKYPAKLPEQCHQKHFPDAYDSFAMHIYIHLFSLLLRVHYYSTFCVADTFGNQTALSRQFKIDPAALKICIRIICMFTVYIRIFTNAYKNTKHMKNYTMYQRALGAIYNSLCLEYIYTDTYSALETALDNCSFIYLTPRNISVLGVFFLIMYWSWTRYGSQCIK